MPESIFNRKLIPGLIIMPAITVGTFGDAAGACLFLAMLVAAALFDLHQNVFGPIGRAIQEYFN